MSEAVRSVYVTKNEYYRKCDKCGCCINDRSDLDDDDEYSAYTHIEHFSRKRNDRFGSIFSFEPMYTNSTVKYDLCNKCYKKFVAWLNNKEQSDEHNDSRSSE